MKKLLLIASVVFSFAGNTFAQGTDAAKPKSIEQPSGGTLGDVRSELTGSSAPAAAPAVGADKAPEGTAENKVALSKLENVIYMDLKDGRVEIELLPDLAPNHVARFKELVRQGFYNNSLFHRVIEGFMAQTGDPTGTGRGGSGQNIKAEFSAEKHVRGTLSMARAMDPDSADSQFFICFQEAPHLDGQYTIFARVIKGMEFIDKVKKGDGPNGKVTDPDKIIKMQVAADTDEKETPASTPSAAASGAAATATAVTEAPKADETPVTGTAKETPVVGDAAAIDEANKQAAQKLEEVKAADEAKKAEDEKAAEEAKKAEADKVAEESIKTDNKAAAIEPVKAEEPKPAQPAKKAAATKKPAAKSDTIKINTPEVKKVEEPAKPTTTKTAPAKEVIE